MPFLLERRRKRRTISVLSRSSSRIWPVRLVLGQGRIEGDFPGRSTGIGRRGVSSRYAAGKYRPIGVAVLEMKKKVGPVGTRHAVTLALALWFAAGCSPGIGAQQDAFVPLVRSMADRLNTADQVALSKWDTGQPVYDGQREAQVIANAATMASEYGLTAEDAINIFSDQVEANKEVQYALLNNWRRQGDAPATPRQSLAGVIRPILDKLQASIMQNLQSVAPLRSIADCHALVASAVGQVAEQASLDVLHRAALDRAVARICVKS
ncbi:hypothetical protein LMG9964_06642 [Paraburkholderia phenoliruptrix]|uniref:chorismate mutase n=2 Tax=Paraburkholderia TaxID=1822464 RepID=A0A6J5KH46_9BURK|nr:hypothetical protein LMG9964_06642 [Paraburkholderia phenoliruptrix]